MLPNAALYQTEPRLDYLIFHPEFGESGQVCGQRDFWPRFPPDEIALTVQCQRQYATNGSTKRSEGSMLPNAALYQTEPRLDL